MKKIVGMILLIAFLWCGGYHDETEGCRYGVYCDCHKEGFYEEQKV